MQFMRKLPIPQEIKERYPLTEEMVAVKASRDAEIRAVFEGKDQRMLLVIGPCSADRKEPVLDYIARLCRLYEQVKDKLLIVPRLYTNKPRSSGDGYMGMLHQPNPEDGPDLLKGILSIRDLHRTVLEEYRLTCADEMLYPENHRYLSDLLSYVTVGARSVEDQQHRLTASGLNIPVGMKNPTGGDLSVMMNAIESAHHPHTFLYRGWEVCSKGNPMAHGVLRGYVEKNGEYRSNYNPRSMAQMQEYCTLHGLAMPNLIIDTNHANSGKRYEKQPQIVQDVLQYRRKERGLYAHVKGLMVESYLVDGCQQVDGDVYGQSITDPCLGWEKTENLILRLADSL